MDPPRPAVPRPGQPQRNGPGRLLGRYGEQGGPHLVRVQEFLAPGGPGGADVEPDTVPARLGDEAGQRGRGAGGGDGQPPGLVLDGLGLGQQDVGGVDEVYGGGEHVAPEGGEDRPPGGALEQLRAEAFLQSGDAAARHRLGHPRGGRPVGEAAVLADAHERPTRSDQIHAPSLCGPLTRDPCGFGMETPVDVLDRMARRG